LKCEYAVFMRFSKQNRLKRRIKPAPCWSASVAARPLQQPQPASTLRVQLRTA
jgi:hypothetical protein